MCSFKHEHTGSAVVRPEEDNFSTRPKDTVKLSKDASYLLVGEMFDYSEVVNAVKTRRVKRQSEDAAVQDLDGVRVVAAVEMQSRRQDIEGGKMHRSLQ